MKDQIPYGCELFPNPAIWSTDIEKLNRVKEAGRKVLIQPDKMSLAALFWAIKDAEGETP
jgi:hypothetical protein